MVGSRFHWIMDRKWEHDKHLWSAVISRCFWSVSPKHGNQKFLPIFSVDFRRIWQSYCKIGALQNGGRHHNYHHRRRHHHHHQQHCNGVLHRFATTQQIDSASTLAIIISVSVIKQRKIRHLGQQTEISVWPIKQWSSNNVTW